MFCVKCGKSLNSNFNFCPYCGTNVTTGEAPAASANANNSFDIRDGVLVKYTGRASHVIVPNGVRMIGKFAFCEDSINFDSDLRAYVENNEYVTKITLPNSVTEIESFAFARCVKLTDVILSNKMTAIPPYAFSHCGKLSHVYIPDSIKYIQAGAFSTKRTILADRVCGPLNRTTIPEHTILEGDSFSEDVGLSDTSILYTARYGGILFPGEKGIKVAHYTAPTCPLNRKYQQIYGWISSGACRHCGGTFSLFSRKCVSCGRKKDYDYYK